MLTTTPTLSVERAHEFLVRANRAVISTVSARGKPEAALVNYGVTQELELIFETLQTSRKYTNLLRNPSAAFVMAFDHETVQYEGIVDRPKRSDLEPLLDDYFAAYPDGLGHRGWPGLVYMRVRPLWVRVSHYDSSWKVEEMTFQDRAYRVQAASSYDPARNSLHEGAISRLLRGLESISGLSASHHSTNITG
jgi:uncharacterized pyridoxamine 5'-phosphate oxidase family protein